MRLTKLEATQEVAQGDTILYVPQDQEMVVQK